MIAPVNSKIIILTLFFVSYFNSLFAQSDFKPGFIITNSNDTIRGFIDYQKNSINAKECVFKKTEDAAETTYTPRDIKSYRIENSKYYVSKTVKGERIFLEFLLNGVVDLYYYKAHGKEFFFLEKDTSLIELTNDTRIIYTDAKGRVNSTGGFKYEVQSNKYKGDLNYAFRDDPKITKKINTTFLSDRSLIKLVRSYHNDVCKDYACIEYSKSTKSTILIGPKITLIEATMQMKSSSDRARDTQLSYGVQIQYHPAYLFYRWNIITGLEYGKNSFNGDFYGNIFDQPDGKTYHIKLNYNAFRIPLIFQYSFPMKRIQPLFYFGVNGVILTNPNYSIISRVFTPNPPTYGLPYSERSDLRRFQLGLTGGIGVMKNIKEKLTLNIKAGYESRFPLQNSGNILDFQVVQSISVSAGVLFKI